MFELVIGVIVHNLAEQKQSHQIQGAHKGKVSGLCFADRDRLLSCGVDCNIKLWDASGSSREQNSVRAFALFILFPARLTSNSAAKTSQRVRWKITFQVRTSTNEAAVLT